MQNEAHLTYLTEAYTAWLQSEKTPSDLKTFILGAITFLPSERLAQLLTGLVHYGVLSGGEESLTRSLWNFGNDLNNEEKYDVSMQKRINNATNLVARTYAQLVPGPVSM